MDFQHLAHALNGKHRLMLMNEGVPYPDVLAKYAAAFRRMSRSSVTCVFRRNWTPVPPQTGHAFQRKLDTCSRPNWTLGA
jgi:hypothetical protein